MTKTVTAAGRISFVEARRQRTDRVVADLAPVIAALRASGVTSLRGIATAQKRPAHAFWSINAGSLGA
jgi:hypothetical protein